MFLHKPETDLPCKMIKFIYIVSGKYGLRKKEGSSKSIYIKIGSISNLFHYLLSIATIALSATIHPRPFGQCPVQVLRR